MGARRRFIFAPQFPHLQMGGILVRTALGSCGVQGDNTVSLRFPQASTSASPGSSRSPRPRAPPRRIRAGLPGRGPGVCTSDELRAAPAPWEGDPRSGARGRSETAGGSAAVTLPKQQQQREQLRLMELMVIRVYFSTLQLTMKSEDVSQLGWWWIGANNSIYHIK